MSTNIWIGEGRLTRDPETRTTSDGRIVATLRLAVDRVGDDTADFFDLAAFGMIADTMAEHLTKGRRILVEGPLRHNTWTDPDSGEGRSKVEILVNRFSFLDAPARNEEPARA